MGTGGTGTCFFFWFDLSVDYLFSIGGASSLADFYLGIAKGRQINRDE